MSPRRNRPSRGVGRPAAVPPEDGDEGAGGGARHGLERTEQWRGETWVMRPVAGSGGKTYRCPGCDQEIPPGVGHIVAWPEYGGVDARRHWHRACWNARDRRSAKLPRSRNAPRF